MSTSPASGQKVTNIVTRDIVGRKYNYLKTKEKRLLARRLPFSMQEERYPIMSHEVIAYLAPDEQTDESESDNGGLQALVRLDDGSVSIEDVADESDLNGTNLRRIEQRVPIKDPQTNEVIGYEMQPVRKTS